MAAVPLNARRIPMDYSAECVEGDVADVVVAVEKKSTEYAHGEVQLARLRLLGCFCLLFKRLSGVIVKCLVFVFCSSVPTSLVVSKNTKRGRINPT
jgi:hypothetical protein